MPCADAEFLQCGEVRLTDTGAERLNIILREDRRPIFRRISLSAGTSSDNHGVGVFPQDAKRIRWRHSLAAPPTVSCLEEEPHVPGVSSTDTHRSSVRYEPVIADRSYSPPSPDLHGNGRRVRGNRSASSHSPDSDMNSDIDGMEDDLRDVENDPRREEEQPLNSRRRPSSPSDHRNLTNQYGGRQGSAYMALTGSGNIYVPKTGTQSTASEQQRHHTGLPRMGTGLVPAPTSVQNPNHVPPSSTLYNQQNPSSIVTSRVTSSETEQFFPVVTTTLKPTYEVDETGLWSYSRGNETERNQFPGYPSSSLAPHNPAAASGGNTAASRFINKRPSFGSRHPFESNMHRHRRESPQYESSFKKLRSGCRRKCSWKCTALTFIIISVVLFALVAFFLVQMLNNEGNVVEVPSTTQCITGGNSAGPTYVEIEGVDKSVELQFNRKSLITIPPHAFNWMQVYVEEPSHFKFNISVSPNAEMIVYGRKGLRPTHTKYDFSEKIDGSLLPSARGSHTSFISMTTTISDSSSRSRRSVSSLNNRVKIGFLEYLEAGTWHLAVFNDGNEEEGFEVTTSVSEGLSSCPSSCHNNGDCVGGVCKCFPGFQGKDCSQVSCVVTCRGNGVYSHGKCVCFSGWKGVECATPSDHCVDPDCDGHGKCGPDGECVCENGYKGETCQELDCIDSSCSGHGICIQGQCRCDRGWKGTVCSEEDILCIANCGGHGTFDEVTKRCICQPGWAGTDCSIDLNVDVTLPSPTTATCRPACHAEHGVCVDGACRCEDGWNGEACDQRQCHAKCDEHGSCSRGECVCDHGWNGELCTFDGCPDDCSRNGNCLKDAEGEWYCSCRTGWKGKSCAVEVETQCSDGKDNDKDTLVDCSDPDCCSQRICRNLAQCRGGPDPAYQVKGVQGGSPLPSTASFFDRAKFLMNTDGVQTDGDLTTIQPRRASVIRGRVFTQDGSPLVSVQVQVSGQSSYGSTKTRSDGWFDMLVNGGGSLTLALQRSSFVSTSVTVFTSWNDFLIIPTIRMRTLREPVQLESKGSDHCDVSKLLQPKAAVLISSVRAYTAAECSEKGSVIPEIQAIREAVSLPGTDASLVYLSSRVQGYQSVLMLSLVNGEKPANLLLVHVRISVQGVLFEKKFEPVSELRYTYEWPRVDAYGQKVYGMVSAKVMVGYEYESCSEYVWTTMGAKLMGHDSSQKSSLGLWSLDIHHTYHPDKGVVYLGNGGEMRLLEQPPMMSTVMGNGMSRHDTCDRCDGPAVRSRLLSPVALASDSLGNVYIGDHNFIRKLDPTGNVTSLYSTRNAPAKYYMAVSPVMGGTLYFTHPSEKRIYRLSRMSFSPSRRVHNLATNYEVVAGNGAACYPLQKDDCGDGKVATNARLTAPKGLTVDKDGRVYFVDGNRIRTIEPRDQIITTFAGSLLVSGTRPLSCEGSISLEQLELNFPTDLTMSSTENALYILDGDVVVRIDIASRQASLAAGVPVHCTRNAARNPDDRDARKVNLVSPTSISISPQDGALYISETDQKYIHRVRRIDTFSGRISTVAGVDSECDCAVQDCQCFGGDGDFARSALLHNPTAITTTPDGSVYIADQLNLRIRKIVHSLPVKNNKDQYSVSNPDTNQLYSFDHNGRHLTTKNIITGTPLYSFVYDSSGRLNSVTDVNNNRLSVEYVLGKPVRIDLPNSNNLAVNVNQNGFMTQISRDRNEPIASFTYQGKSGLIRSKVKGRHASSFYIYDVNGRLISATSSTGASTSLHAQINATKHTVTMETAATAKGDNAAQIGVGRRDVIITTEPGYLCDIITTVEGAMTTRYKRWTDNSISVHYLDDSELTLETKPHPVLGLTAPFLAKRTIQLPADPLENKIEWRTRKEKENGFGSQQFLLGRRMRVNDRNILSLDFSQATMLEKIYDDHTKFMLRIRYNNRGLPTLWMPKNGESSYPVNVTYDSSGHASTWQRGLYNEAVRYDSRGNVQSAVMADGTVWRYINGDRIVHLSVPGASSQYTFSYNHDDSLQRVTLPSGLGYTIDKKIGTGFMRTTISGPGNTLTLVQDHNDRGNLLTTFYPGEKRKVIYRYDAHGHMTEILHDSARTTMLRDPQSGELVSVSTNDCTMRFHRNGPLVQRHVVTSSKDGGLLATFDYEHDANLRLNSLGVKVNGTRLPMEHYTYNDVSGKLTTFGSYRIIDLAPNLYAVGNEISTLTKQIDNNGRIVETEVDSYGSISFNMEVKYDVGGRVSTLKLTIGMYANATKLDYTYNSRGALKRVSVNDATKWLYSYDMDGKLLSVDNQGTQKELRYDSEGRLTSFGDIQYVFDTDGFLRQRGNEVFEYDSMGHLVKAYRLDNSYEIKYGYDGFGRLAMRVDVRRKQVLRYLYADVTKPTVLTHVYNSTSGMVTMLRYDVEGHLFAMERDGHSWSVVCDHVGTPLAVMDIAGYLAKKIEYTPFGEVLHDSAPGIHVYIGFRGGIYDVSTGLVHYNDRSMLELMNNPRIISAKPLGPRPTTEESSGKLHEGVEYDALIGQFTSSGIVSLSKLGTRTAPLKMYQVADPVNPLPKYNHMTDITSWLDALGFELQNVAPDPQIASRQKDKSSAECQLSHHLSSYMNLQTTTPSVLVPGIYANEKPVPGGSLFAQGLVVVVERGAVSTQVVDSATNDVKRLSSIINGADVVVGRNTDSPSAAMSLSLEGKAALYLTKPASMLERDSKTLRLNVGQEKLLQSSYDDQGHPAIAVSLHENQIRAESGYAIINIIYVNDGETLQDRTYPTSAHERERILADARLRAEKEAWSREKDKIRKGLRTRWSAREKQQLLSRGYLSSYEVRLSWDPEIYPELADSGRNLKFVRKVF
ncbi:teneurin-3-like isoform X4 [Clavelina lepadiformis]|uniref:teneurin-3-like isoform X4 n=1 Tax=Clavelina lepadiformis TaxID=159417 RepID=UPI004041789F